MLKGTPHVTDSQGDNLMSETQPHGDNLTADQCKSIWQHLEFISPIAVGGSEP